MDYLRKLFKNKDKPINVNLAVMAAVGIILLIVSGTLFKGGASSQEEPITENPFIGDATVSHDEGSYEGRLEKRLEELLCQVEGVGKVNVMVTVSYSEEIVVAEDVSSEESVTTETDAQGGSREVVNKNIDSKKIILSTSGGAQQPLILKEIVPKVEGVIIVAEGGDSVLIKEALINAAKTVLGVESHKVQILKMK